MQNIVDYRPAIEAMAASDASIDGRTYSALSEADKKRYRVRSAKALAAAYRAARDAGASLDDMGKLSHVDTELGVFDA